MPRAALFCWPLHGTRSHFSLQSEGVIQIVTVAFSLSPGLPIPLPYLSSLCSLPKL